MNETMNHDRSKSRNTLIEAANSAAKSGMWHEAHSLWLECLILEPGDFWANFWVAATTFKIGNRDEAIGMLLKIQAADSERGHVLTLLTEFYLEKRQFSEAFETLKLLQNDKSMDFFTEYRLACWIIREGLIPLQSIPDIFSLPSELSRYTTVNAAESVSQLLRATRRAP